MLSGSLSLVSAAEEGELNPLVPAPLQVLGIVVGLFLLLALVVALVVARSRRGGLGPAEGRLAEVDRLHAEGRIDDTERAAARQRILDGL